MLVSIVIEMEDKQKIIDRLEQAEKTIKECRAELKNVDFKKAYSKFVCRCGDCLGIYGKNMLKVIFDENSVELHYQDDSYYRHLYDDELHYETVELDKLERGDVICTNNDDANNLKVADFAVYMGDGKFQYLKTSGDDSDIEFIDMFRSVTDDCEVIRFLRK